MPRCCWPRPAVQPQLPGAGHCAVATVLLASGWEVQGLQGQQLHHALMTHCCAPVPRCCVSSHKISPKQRHSILCAPDTCATRCGTDELQSWSITALIDCGGECKHSQAQK